MKRWDIINSIIKKYNYKTYLEVGVRTGTCIHKINCVKKYGIDPDDTNLIYKDFTYYKMSSDDFFEKNYKFQHTKKFDCIFIDGLHHAGQVIKDIQNAILILTKYGTIIVHDCNPQSYESQIIPRQQKIWNGDIWRAWMFFREYIDLAMFVIDADEGCGIIRDGFQKVYNHGNCDYYTFEKNKKEMLNLISIKEFEKWLYV